MSFAQRSLALYIMPAVAGPTTFDVPLATATGTGLTLVVPRRTEDIPPRSGAGFATEIPSQLRIIG